MCLRNELACKHAFSTNAIGERTAEKLEARDFRTVNSASNYPPQGLLCKSDRFLLPQATNASSLRLYSSSDVENTMKEFLSVGEPNITLFSARTYKAESTIGMTRNIQTSILDLFITGAGWIRISKSILSPLWQNDIQHCNIPPFRTADKKPLDWKDLCCCTYILET